MTLYIDKKCADCGMQLRVDEKDIHADDPFCIACNEGEQ